MTATALLTPFERDAVRRDSLVELARIETATMLTRASIWIGFVVSVVVAVTGALADEEWSAQKYQSLVPLAIYPMTLTTFVAGVRAGHRDRSHHGAPLSEDAPLDGDDRAWARLASLIVPVGSAALLTIVISVGSRIEGGFWIGEGTARNDRATHSILELLQPPLVVAVVGAAAIAVGRAVVRSGPAIVLGVVALFMTGSVYWMWNADYVYATALMQIQPVEDLDAVHWPTVGLHDLYLVGLAAGFCGLAVRGPVRRRLALGGAAIAALSVVAQLVVAPQ
ncbi:hypothetical protein [Ilumatobacter sp.]|uniref:hypothetical protein n=1 Tax=Ilumatobacter sp. TaxID=1967498 RepID=UPI003C4C688E